AAPEVHDELALHGRREAGPELAPLREVGLERVPHRREAARAFPLDLLHRCLRCGLAAEYRAGNRSGPRTTSGARRGGRLRGSSRDARRSGPTSGGTALVRDVSRLEPLDRHIIALFYSVMRRPRQGGLPLHRGTWGGRRPGPGRKPGPNPRVRHRSRPRFPLRYPCHVTLVVREGLPSLRSVSVVLAVEASFRRGCERKAFRLAHYSIQGDHLHAIVEADGPEALGRGMKSLAARFALAVNRALGRGGAGVRGRYHHPLL